MRISPWLVGGAVVAASAGAIVGSRIETAPLVERGPADITARDRPASLSGEEPVPMAMPDHYPLETAQGRFAIGELPLRGRLRDTAVAMSWERERRPSPDFAATLAREEQAARLAREAALIAYTARLPAGTPPPAPAAPQPTASRVEQQTAPVDSASLENAGNASSRMIDVDAVLAARE